VGARLYQKIDECGEGKSKAESEIRDSGSYTPLVWPINNASTRQQNAHRPLPCDRDNNRVKCYKDLKSEKINRGCKEEKRTPSLDPGIQYVSKSMIQEFEARFKPQWFGLGFLRSGKLAPRSIEPEVVDVRQLELFTPRLKTLRETRS
jgi:hypothetical protein